MTISEAPVSGISGHPRRYETHAARDTNSTIRAICAPCMAERRSVVLFEGLPGSGKTTTSNQLAAVYLQRGTPCVWVREETKDHPFFGPEIRRLHRRADYDEICLAQWRRLVGSRDQGRW